MCIIQGEVKHVSNTKIFVAPLIDGRQLTVYCNEVSMGKNNTQNLAMILPFPKSNCEFFDLSDYSNLFEDLNYIINWPKANSTRESQASSLHTYSNNLKVFKVGSYSASIVPSIADFSRIDQNIFTLNPKIFSFLSEMYEKDYSFVVCQLDIDKKYHPFGYIHMPLPSGQLFVPTMHYHDHGIDGLTLSTPFVTENKSSGPSILNVDWDHEIYVWNRPLQVIPPYFLSGWGNQVLPYLSVDKLPINIEPSKMIYGYKIGKDYHNNHDLLSVKG